MLKSLLLFLLVSLSFSILSAQDPPGCSSSRLQLQSLAVGGTEVRATFLSSAAPEVVTYDLLHEFTRNGEPGEELVSSESPLITISFFPQELHTFTAINRCTDGTVHTGSSLIFDFGAEGVDLNCPVPTNLFIESFSPALVAFGWDNADTVDFWQVTYQAEGLPPQDFTVSTPFVEQALLPVVRHTFSLFAVCDEEGLVESAQSVSPTVTFSLIIVEDVKLLPVTCDSLSAITWDAFLMECTLHGAFESDKEAFAYTHGCEPCTTATATDQSGPPTSSWTIRPNPVRRELILEYYLPRPDQMLATVYDIFGRSVFTYRSPGLLPAGEGRLTLPLADLPVGGYWLELRAGPYVQVKKLVRAK